MPISIKEQYTIGFCKSSCITKVKILKNNNLAAILPYIKPKPVCFAFINIVITTLFIANIIPVANKP